MMVPGGAFFLANQQLHLKLAKREKKDHCLGRVVLEKPHHCLEKIRRTPVGMVNIHKISREITTYWLFIIFYLNCFFLDLVHQQYLKNFASRMSLLQVFVVEANIHLSFFSWCFTPMKHGFTPTCWQELWSTSRSSFNSQQKNALFYKKLQGT